MRLRYIYGKIYFCHSERYVIKYSPLFFSAACGFVFTSSMNPISRNPEVEILFVFFFCQGGKARLSIPGQTYSPS